MPINNFSDMDHTASVIAIMAGMWGAILNFVKRDKREHSLTKTVLYFIFDMIVNIGITMLIYIGCIGYGLNDLLSVAIAGFLGHQGTRSFYIMELILTEKIGAKRTFEKLSEDKEK